MGKRPRKVEKDAVKLTPCSVHAEGGQTMGSTREEELQAVNNGGRPWEADSSRGMDQTGLGKGGEREEEDARGRNRRSGGRRWRSMDGQWGNEPSSGRKKKERRES